MQLVITIAPSSRLGIMGAAVFVNGREVLGSWSYSEGGARQWWVAWRAKQRARNQ
jgi:hypothetical protein